MSSRTIMLLVVAFVVGAVAPLLGLLAAAFFFGSWWAVANKGQPTKCDPQLMRDIKEMERIEHQKRRQRR